MCVIKRTECYKILFLFPYLHTITGLLKILLTSHWCPWHLSHLVLTDPLLIPIKIQEFKYFALSLTALLFQILNVFLMKKIIHGIYIRHFLSLWIPWTYLSVGQIEVNLISIILFTSAIFHCTYVAVLITIILATENEEKRSTDKKTELAWLLVPCFLHVFTAGVNWQEARWETSK